MEPFLKRIATAFYHNRRAGLGGYAFVFPNRRAGLFFRKYLAGCADVPVFSPAIITINELFSQLSQQKICDRIELLFKLYAVYKEVAYTGESFDRFLFWGEIILNDFSDIDKFGANAQQLFSNLSDLRELEADPLDYLSEEQLAAVRAFWSGFGEKGGHSPFREDFLLFWKNLYPVYLRFREKLQADGKAYEGMLMREVAEQLKKEGFVWPLPYKKVVFIGFNALTRMEEELFIYLRDAGIGDFYWDYASDWIRDPLNRSSYFMERNLKNFTSEIVLEEERLPVPHIEVCGVASAVAQAKGVGNILNTLYPAGGDEERWIETAVALPDENLLFPLLTAIPEQIGKINVTMGYSLEKSPVAGLIDLVAEMQRNVRIKEGEPEFYHKDVTNLLNHRYLSAYEEDTGQLRKKITDNNLIFIPPSFLQVNPLFAAIFKCAPEKGTLYGYLSGIIEKIVPAVPGILAETDGEEAKIEASLALEVEFIDNYMALLNRMERSCSEFEAEMSNDSWFKLLRRLVQSESIPFQGEPLSGLQVMGVLETRALDFRNLIILSMNEGIFPLPAPSNSLIPYNLRRGFGLPVYEYRDAVYAYHFYRLIQRAEKVFLFYDTRTDGLRSGEASRYIRQLKYLYNVSFSEKLMAYTIVNAKPFSLSMDKTPEIMGRLNVYLEDGGRFLSASSVNTYLECPLRFYFRYVRRLDEDEEVQERVEANVFGSLFHKTMELLYEPYKERMISPEALEALSRDEYLLTKGIKRAFEEVLYRGRTVKALEGEHYLIGEVIRRYARQLLKCDARLAPFEYLGSEEKITSKFRMSDGRQANFKVLIDRVDRVAGRVRLADYKTGRGEAVFSSVGQLFDPALPNRPKEVLQLFLYALVYFQERKGTDVVPSLLFLRTLFSGDSEGVIVQKNGRNLTPVTSFIPYKEEFVTALNICLTEIFDPAIPFTQTDDKKSCEYCPFATLCL